MAWENTIIFLNKKFVISVQDQTWKYNMNYNIYLYFYEEVFKIKYNTGSLLWRGYFCFCFHVIFKNHFI